MTNTLITFCLFCVVTLLVTGCVTTGTAELPTHESPADDHMVD